MKITQDVREYAATHGLKEDEALTRGMEEKARAFVEKGAEVYAKA
jgi:phosphomethylpyrimidine synthase